MTLNEKCPCLVPCLVFAAVLNLSTSLFFCSLIIEPLDLKILIKNIYPEMTRFNMF